MGVLVAYCPGKGHNVVLGKTRRADETVVNKQQRLLQFDIPADTLEAALNKFQNTCGNSGRHSKRRDAFALFPGVTGRYSPEQALREILRGTGGVIDSPIKRP